MLSNIWRSLLKRNRICTTKGFTFPRRATRGGGVRHIVRRILCGVRRILNLIFLRFLQILKRNINGDSHIDFNAFNDISNA